LRNCWLPERLFARMLRMQTTCTGRKDDSIVGKPRSGKEGLRTLGVRRRALLAEGHFCMMATGEKQKGHHGWMPLSYWCERRDSNPHGGYPPDPKSGASANSATFAFRIITVRALYSVNPSYKNHCNSWESKFIFTLRVKSFGADCSRRHLAAYTDDLPYGILRLK
jgi:hypothetical protein